VVHPAILTSPVSAVPLLERQWTTWLSVADTRFPESSSAASQDFRDEYALIHESPEPSPPTTSGSTYLLTVAIYPNSLLTMSAIGTFDSSMVLFKADLKFNAVELSVYFLLR